MKNVSDVLKSNPIVVASAVVAIAALAVLFFVVRPAGQAHLDEMKARKQDEGQIRTLMNTNVPIPGETPEAPPRNITITVNPAALKALTTIYDEMKTQFTSVFKKAADINQANHEPMLPDLFPDAKSDSDRLDARGVFRDSLHAMLGRDVRGAIAGRELPRLNSGAPISSERIDQEYADVTAKFLAGYFTQTTEADLSSQDKDRLERNRRDAVMKLMHDQARRISIYAYDNPSLEDYPFDVGAWAKQENTPSMRDIWEGQMSLWIQEDLVRAIALANRNEGTSRSGSVLGSPVKRLVAIKVFEGYVGVNSMGAMNRFGQTRDATGRSSAELPDMIQNQDYLKTTIEEMKTYNIDKPLPAAFNVSPTGRIGNAIYDVRHAQLDLVVDFKQLPALLEALGKVNFMTVLSTRITDVDEYLALEEGYLYGEADCVNIELLIETIWLREWTSKLMPQVIKDELGIVDKPADGTTPGTPGTPGAPVTPVAAP